MRRPDKSALARWIAIAVVFLLAPSAAGHHATATEYDISKTATLRGTITRVDWANPHIHVNVEIKLPVTPQHFACATGITLFGGDHFTFVVGV